MSKDRCPYISRKCADCMDDCIMTGHICELEFGHECEYWDDKKKEEKGVED